MNTTSKHNHLFTTLAALVFTLLFSLDAAAASTAESTSAFSHYKDDIEVMKSQRRGPFKGIRWFCHDGTVHPPKPYPCRDRGGGIQHALISDITTQIREDNILIANFLAEVDVDDLLQRKGNQDILASILLERFLIGFDDGWIMRQARFYRGAFQIEDEEAAGREILNRLLQDHEWLQHRYAMILAAARSLPHGTATPLVSRIRALAATINKKDSRFSKLRSKIHGNPDQKDAQRVRDFAAVNANNSTRNDLEELAKLIDELEDSGNTGALITEIADTINNKQIVKQLNSMSDKINASTGQGMDDYDIMSRTLSLVRNNVDNIAAQKRLDVTDNLLKIEENGFALLQKLSADLARFNRRQHLRLLTSITHALYGTGLLTNIEFEQTIKLLDNLPNSIQLQQYRQLLSALEKIPVFAQQRLSLYFSPVINRWHAVEPQVELFIPDFLRGSHLLAFTTILDTLGHDVAKASKVEHRLFDETANVGLTRINPGLAKGHLYDIEQLDDAADSSNSIVIVPETLAEIQPVAGILTAFEGNQLSHVQLLARNLGVPNVVVSGNHLEKLKNHHGKQIVLAATPEGVVLIDELSEQYQSVFSAANTPQQIEIKPDLNKLNLEFDRIIPTSKLRGDDSGRRVGPKAAQVGELSHHYPDAVAPGLAIPFGIFKQVLNQPFKDKDLNGFEWLKQKYQYLDSVKADRELFNQEKNKILAEFRQWIVDSPLPEGFVSHLKQSLQEHFGEDGSYGVFVRSDTNVEDLEGFTGAGLNLTVANVVGSENIIKAIKRVWASPFTERAFGWRQALMSSPEHVYAAVLLHKSVNSEKSGVLVSKDIYGDLPRALTVVVNEGVAGGVDGLSAETLVINLDDAQSSLLASATTPYMRTLNSNGGVSQIRTSESARVLTDSEIKRLVTFSDELPRWFTDDSSEVVADVEFGFIDGKLILFQIRPFVESKSAQGNQFLNELDQQLKKTATLSINLTEKVAS